MSGSSNLNYMREALVAMQRVIDRFDQQGVIIGGVAASILGKPRFTVDLEAMLFASVDKIPQILEISGQEGISPRIKDADQFARKSRVLLLQYKKSNIKIDISLGVFPFEQEVIERSRLVKIDGFTIRLPSVEDLIILKAIAHRPQDLLDIQSLFDQNPMVDKARILDWVSQFAELLESHDILEDLQKIIHD